MAGWNEWITGANMTLSEVLNSLNSARVGLDVKDKLYWSFYKIVELAIKEGNANFDVAKAAGRFKDLASRLDAGDKIGVDALNLASQKIDKDVGAVTMADLSQAVKTALTGGSTAVVGPDTILEENVVNNQISLIKRTAMGNATILSTRTGYKLPNYNTETHTLEIDQLILVVGKNRYVAGSATLSCATLLNTFSSVLIAYSGIKNEFRVIREDAGASLTEDFVFIGSINYSNAIADGGVFRQVNMSIPVTINGSTLTEYQKDYHKNLPQTFSANYYTPTSPQACDGTGLEGLSEASTAQDTYNLYNQFVSDHPQYVKRVTLGNDSTNTLPIYSYEFQMPEVDDQRPKNKPTILLVSGTHGNKVGVGDYQTSIFALYFFMKDLVENWKDSEVLSQLRAQFKFVVIPVVNPWGVNNKQRVNGRGVDLNRNYGPNWEQTATGDYYSGTNAFSEKESQYVKRIIDENPNALFFADFHTRGGNVAESQMMLMLLTNNTPPTTHLVAKQTLQMCSMSFKSQFAYLNDDIWQGFIRREALAYSTSYAETKGVKSILVETFPSVTGNSNMTTNNLDVMKMSTEEIGNAVAFAIQSYYI